MLPWVVMSPSIKLLSGYSLRELEPVMWAFRAKSGAVAWPWASAASKHAKKNNVLRGLGIADMTTSCNRLYGITLRVRMSRLRAPF